MASNTPKTMSSRLAGMKFMQRSVSKPAASSSQPSPSTPSGPPPAKRVRLSNGTSAPATPATPTEDERNQEALLRAAERAGETKWVLSVQETRNAAKERGLRVVYGGFAMIDREGSEGAGDGEEEGNVGRMKFGGGLKQKAKKESTPSDDSDSEDGSSASSESEFDSDDPTAELIRETKREVAAKEKQARRARKKDAVRDVHDMPAKRPVMIQEDMDLRGLTSLSSGSRGRGISSMECFQCGEKGHAKKDCPKSKGRPFPGRGRGGGRGGFRPQRF